jgi:hypothetical protein
MGSYFVVHLMENDRPSRGQPFEIQVLDSEGRAIACGYVGTDDTSLDIEGQVVPAAVLEAARRQVIGQGDYVNERGNSIMPF